MFEDRVEIIVHSKKYGEQRVIVDHDAVKRLEGLRVYVWGTDRHSSLYALLQNANTRSSDRLHRHLMNAPKNTLVDHINGLGLDNRKSNLRITDSFGNNNNARKRKNCSSKYKGVSYYKRGKKWKAQIQFKGSKVSLGYYQTELDAAKAYDEAAKEMHTSYARLNNV